MLLTAAFNDAHGAPTRFLVIDTTLGLVLVVSGLVAWERRPSVRTGPLLVGAEPCGRSGRTHRRA